MRCLSCMTENTATRRFCAECGAPLPLPCPACGFDNEPTAKFCGGCGKPFSEAISPEPVSGAPRPVGAERRQLTVMFCDLVGSTALASRLDPEDLREVIGAFHKCVAETIERYDGFIARYMGDGVLIYFGYPHAHEDDAERAVRAGLAVVEAVGRVPTPELLQVRVGLATGLAVVGDLIGSGAAREQAVIGETPNLAARLQALAGNDEVVIPENTRRLVGNLFDYQSLGELEVKGLQAPIVPFGLSARAQPAVGSRRCVRARRRWSGARRRSSYWGAGGNRRNLAQDGWCWSPGSPGSVSRDWPRRSGRASKVSHTPDCVISAHHIIRIALSPRSSGNSSGLPVSSAMTRPR
jgi:class 3 adenylate cyclase